MKTLSIPDAKPKSTLLPMPSTPFFAPFAFGRYYTFRDNMFNMNVWWKTFFTYFFKGKLFLPIVFQCGHRGKLALIYQYGEVKYGRKMGEHNFGQGGIRLKVIRGRYKANFYQGHFNTHFEILGHPDTPLNWFWYNLFTKRSCRCKTRERTILWLSW